MKNRLIAIVAALMASSVILASDPDEALKSIEQYRTDFIKQARESGSNANFAEMQAKTKEMALEAIKGVDTDKVEPAKGFSWAKLYMEAGRYDGIEELCERFAESKPSAEQTFDAHMMCLQAFSELKQYDKAQKTVSHMTPPTDMQAMSLVSMSTYLFADNIAKNDGLDKALGFVSDLANKLPKSVEDEKLKPRLESARASLAQKKAELLVSHGRRDEGLDFLRNHVENKTYGERGTRSLKALLVKTEITGSMAPTFDFSKTIGKFKGMESLKGKVVLLDFFAHWCGPCKAAFPDMRAMYDDLKDDGLEIIGLTTYYGFYNQDRELSQEDEFARMGGFATDFRINWPMAYVERDVFDAYGITGIPTAYLIDRDGNVHSYKVGYSKESFADFRKEVEKLLKK